MMYEDDIKNENTEVGSQETVNSAGGEQAESERTEKKAEELKVTEMNSQGRPQYENYPLEEKKWSPMPKEEPKKKEPRKKGGVAAFFGKLAACVVLGLVFGLCTGVGFYGIVKFSGLDFGALTQKEDIQIQEVTVPVNSMVEAGTTEPVKAGTDTIRIVTGDVSDMVEKVMPAMVSIVNTYTSRSSFWGYNYSREEQSSGSGIIVGQSDQELIIVTNHHVVADQESLEVTFIDGQIGEAKIKGSDPDMDLAVIAVSLDGLKDETKKAIAIAQMGDSQDVKLGSPVVAIGNALGYGQSVTTGCVSATDREITFSDGSTGKFIQTDAAINPGNSGGALLNLNGEVIGINSSKIGGDKIDGIGFAIPISNAKPIIETLMNKETKQKNAGGRSSYLGIEPVTITDDAVLTYGYPKGVYVKSVEEGSPAYKAEMYSGDILTKIDGERITSYADLQEELKYHEPGSKGVITVQRQINGVYQEVDLEITFGARPDEN